MESSAFSIVYDKMEGIFGDLAVLPLTPGELVLGFSAAAVSGSLMVAVVVWAALLPFGEALPLQSVGTAVFRGHRQSNDRSCSVRLRVYGHGSGTTSRRCRHSSSCRLSSFPVCSFHWTNCLLFCCPSHGANPVFYIVDGIRFSLTGQAEVSPVVGAVVCVGVAAILWVVSYRLFSIGYRMKS